MQCSVAVVDVTQEVCHVVAGQHRDHRNTHQLQLHTALGEVLTYVGEGGLCANVEAGRQWG